MEVPPKVKADLPGAKVSHSACTLRVESRFWKKYLLPHIPGTDDVEKTLNVTYTPWDTVQLQRKGSSVVRDPKDETWEMTVLWFSGLTEPSASNTAQSLPDSTDTQSVNGQT